MPDTPLHLRPIPVLLVFIGGCLGTYARYAVELFGTPWGLPLPTLGVNLVGAFLLGVLLEGLLRRGPDVGWRQRLRLLLGPGFMGGFTTYSTFAVETVLLTGQGRYVTGFGYAVVSLICGVAAAAAGVWVAANLFRVPRVLPPGHSTLDSTQTLHLATPPSTPLAGRETRPTPEEEAEG
ncbi:fluoride efflux transporter FluC [Gryllotalpicola reticulitermitis]|uniref:Fluoride-specific ion channel FluC n=1 Tax=Gryllotalpicola reticulitermitis TaxID=1184153 RepID=A0ABV8Q9Q7_9MICO